MKPSPLHLTEFALVASLAAGMPSPSTAAETACAVLLTTAADWPSTTALASEAAQRAGLAVTRTTAISARSFALRLAASTSAECTAAIERLRADRGFAVSAEPDQRRTLPPRPSASAAL